jgi:hypothetical protein
MKTDLVGAFLDLHGGCDVVQELKSKGGNEKRKN